MEGLRKGSRIAPGGKKAINAVPGLPQKAGKVILPPILLKKNEKNKS